MPQHQSTPFEPLEMNDIRKRPGSVFDRVFHHHKRFIIRKKGTPRALIVPITDKPSIEQAVTDRELDKMYAAIEKMGGIIKDDVTDTSEKVDEILYGEAYDETQQRSA